MTRRSLPMPDDFRGGLNCPSLRDVCLPALSGRCAVQVSGEREQEAVEDGNGTNQPPGQIELGAGNFATQSGCCGIDLAIKLRPGEIKVCPDGIVASHNVGPENINLGSESLFAADNIGSDQIDVFPDQFEVSLCRHPAGDAGMDGERDGFGLFLFDACVTKALNFGDCVERCFGHVRSLLILSKDIDHSRPDCQCMRQCADENSSGSFGVGSVANPPFVTAAGVAR